MRRFPIVCLLALLMLFLAEGPARAQLQNAQIQGTVTDKATGKPLGGVTVVVSGPALQGDQTEFTDPSGRYLITELPPGDNYVVRFYFNDVVVERPGVRLTQSKTLTIPLSLPTQKSQQKAFVIRERAPSVDTAGTDTRVEINQELLKNTAVRGRTFESVIALAPGAVDPPRGQGGDIGVSISGSTGNENNFLIDGLNTTDPGLGLLATQLNQYFIKEVNIITGGYQAEFGRATGGIVSVVTNSGSNEFHGGIYGSWVPFQLTPQTVARLGEALGTRRRTTSEYDFGFDLGGPIVKDRIWFYAGFAPTFSTFTADRVVRTQTFDPRTGQARIDPSFNCPGYLSDDGLCDGPRVLARTTTEVPGAAQQQKDVQRRYNWIAKIQFNLNPDHNITLSYIGSPESFDGYQLPGDQSANYELKFNHYIQSTQIHDASARYIGKFLDRKLQTEVMYGYHYQSLDQRPDEQYLSQPQIYYRAQPSHPFTLSDFEDAPECQRQMMGQTTFNPCPLTSYTTHGFGLYNQQVLQRHAVLASATYFLRFLGNHAIKLGFDFEDNLNNHFRTFTGPDLDQNDPNNSLLGHRAYQTSADGTQLILSNEYAQRNADGSIQHLNGFRGITEERNYAIYLRDSWNVSFVPGLVLNLGARWEGQEIYGQDGSKQISIYDNWAPRVGAAYDFTRKGRSRLYFNYGRFYESIPLDIGDRQFSGEGAYSTSPSPNCPLSPLKMGGQAVPMLDRSCTFPDPVLNGGRYAQVAPGLKGQYINEIAAGFQYDVGWDVVLGVSYTHRELGNIVEDMSPDGGSFYLIGNPGSPADPDAARGLQQQADDLAKIAAQHGMDQVAQQEAKIAQSKAAAYKAVGAFPRAVRNYDAVTLSANKRLSNRFSLLANYTYSRLIGNYPGTFASNTGQNDPNISDQFDLVDLLSNRQGPLPNDRPHNLKLTGYYVLPVGTKASFTVSLTFTAYSGRPIEVLGFHPYYLNREVFILPRGSGGRTPTVTQFDLHLGYERKLSQSLTFSVFADVLNLFNQQAITNVDDEYTASVVSPVLNGTTADLVHLKSSDGSALVANSNYGQPTAFQSPLYMRLGGRLSF